MCIRITSMLINTDNLLKDVNKQLIENGKLQDYVQKVRMVGESFRGES